MSGIKGVGGQNRKTANERRKLGVQHKKRLALEAPEPPKGDMIIFDDIGENGKKLREQFLPMLMNNGTIGVSDSVALHKFCRVAEDWFRYDKLCLEKGRFTISKDEATGIITKEILPWHKIECDLRAALDICIRDLGLSPLTRDSIKKISTGKPVNRWAIK